ncbi:hypothetical protein BDA99DRAFT_532940 [Phascolomyces articulosus]|uniref:Uncharacterized protein n=1 Tax=Phascolomyces articulosus TaxID=60185 RepID=A0AAD5KJG5_9FUNG|nr:hypothetical protein BDA99DRAFT_532940 [Phascolomyces articulosus]
MFMELSALFLLLTSKALQLIVLSLLIVIQNKMVSVVSLCDKISIGQCHCTASRSNMNEQRTSDAAKCSQQQQEHQTRLDDKDQQQVTKYWYYHYVAKNDAESFRLKSEYSFPLWNQVSL